MFDLMASLSIVHFRRTNVPAVGLKGKKGSILFSTLDLSMM